MMNAMEAQGNRAGERNQGAATPAPLCIPHEAHAGRLPPSVPASASWIGHLCAHTMRAAPAEGWAEVSAQCAGCRSSRLAGSLSSRTRPADATVYVGQLDEQVTDALVWELFVQAGPVGQ